MFEKFEQGVIIEKENVLTSNPRLQHNEHNTMNTMNCKSDAGYLITTL